MEEELSKDLLPIQGEEQFNSFRDIRKGAVAFGTYQKRLFLMMGCYWITASFFLILPFYFFKLPVYCQNTQAESTHCTRTPFPTQPAKVNASSNSASLTTDWCGPTSSPRTPSPTSSASSATAKSGACFTR
jgi:hypothetical protein